MKELSTPVFIEKFTSRIGLSSDLKPTIGTLRECVKAHVKHIPFEFDWNKHQLSPSLALNTLFNKVVECQEGGYCYETCLLFDNFLKAIGFKTRVVISHIYRKGILDLKSCHAVLVVSLEEEWLVDISWKGGIAVPLLLSPSLIQTNGSKFYQIGSEKMGLTVWEKEKSWSPLYLLNFVDNPSEIINKKHEFHQRDKTSEFYKKTIIQFGTYGGNTS